ncbi:serine hydrolase [Hymenobacter rubripertinctus]|uniref:Serine hydrolase n=1 Tax=Hymenobacter rubripertinctus TaxID=2029981 RepID=A0A418QR75_9BACT|nr:serine hydrolase [Hymenobacter rubripertinctus]RIY07726.1 serine hydrolase [Hymenobacter rubripertinctus]
MKNSRHLFWLRTTGVVLTLLLCLNSATQAQSAPDSVDQLVQRTMRQLRIPGVQLAVVRHGQLVKLGNYGLANVQDSVPVTTQTPFFLNSITKAFVGVAVMQLVETGQLDLAAPVGRYLPELPATWHPVTVRQLLTHTSGLPDILPEDALVTENNEKTAWAQVQTQPLDFPAGQQFAYNQTNYLLLGRLIEKLSGQPFAQFIQQRQLEVVGMPHTSIGDAHDVLPQGARGYTYTQYVDGQRRRSPQLRNLFEVFPPSLRPAAGMSSTAQEIASWLVALQRGKLLQPQSLLALWTPGLLTDGSQRGFGGKLTGYALGWPTVSRAEHPAVAPVGGGRSAVFLYPQDELAIVVLTNLQGANPDRFVDALAACYLPDMRAVDGFGLPPTLRALHRRVRQRGFSHLEEEVKQARRRTPTYALPEDAINAWGYSLIEQGQLTDALAVFQLNVRLYPTSANTYDSLAETYAALGNRKLASRHYTRALQLNPQNRTAAEYLQQP